MMDDRAILILVRQCQWKELALHRHGFTSDRLMRLARKVAADGARRRNAVLGDRFEDLVSFLVEKGLDEVMRFDPSRSHALYGRNGGDPFTSYMSDVMDKRIDDFFRRKSEGFADRRYANFAMVEPTDEIELQRAEVEDVIANIDTAKVIAWYIQAAAVEGLPLHDWIIRALNARAASTVEKPEDPAVVREAKDQPYDWAQQNDHWPGQQLRVVVA